MNEGDGRSHSVRPDCPLRMEALSRTTFDAARDGDRDALELIVRTHFRVAFAVARSIVDNPMDAEDVVQDAFVRCWQRIGQCSGPEAFTGWLRSIVRSVALNRVARESIRATQPLESIQASSRTSPDLDLDRSLLADQLSAAIQTLTSVQREVLLLHDLEGFRHADIARLVGLSELMSRKHLSNARRRMRDALREPSPRMAAP